MLEIDGGEPRPKEGPRRRSEEDAFPVAGNPKNPRASSRFSPSHQPLSWEAEDSESARASQRTRAFGASWERGRGKAYTIGQSVQ